MLETYDVGKIADSRYRYDRGGNLTTIVDPMGNEWRYSYNRDGELIETTDPEGKGQRWEYFPDGRLAKLIDGIGNETRLEYRDREVSGISRPFSPKIITHHPGYDEEEVFDLRDRLLLRTIKGRAGTVATTKYRYSRDSRTSSVEGPDGRVEETTVDGMGRPVTIKKTGWGTTAVQYLKRGREVAVTDSSGATSKRYLNTLGLVTRLERPDGTGQNFRYDKRGKVREYETSNGYLHKYLYTALGELECSVSVKAPPFDPKNLTLSTPPWRLA